MSMFSSMILGVVGASVGIDHWPPKFLLARTALNILFRAVGGRLPQRFRRGISFGVTRFSPALRTYRLISSRKRSSMRHTSLKSDTRSVAPLFPFSLHAKKDTDEVLISWSKAEPAAHLHEGVGGPGNAAVVAYGETFNRVSTRKFVATDNNFPERRSAEIRCCGGVAVDYQEDSLPFLDALDRLRQVRDKLGKLFRHDFLPLCPADLHVVFVPQFH